MRDPQRIDRIVAALAELWRGLPDQRLGQLIHNTNPRQAGDGFYVEDDEWLDAIQAETARIREPSDDPT